MCAWYLFFGGYFVIIIIAAKDRMAEDLREKIVDEDLNLDEAAHRRAGLAVDRDRYLRTNLAVFPLPKNPRIDGSRRWRGVLVGRRGHLEFHQRNHVAKWPRY